jgi:HEPN domain-containing protein
MKKHKEELKKFHGAKPLRRKPTRRGRGFRFHSADSSLGAKRAVQRNEVRLWLEDSADSWKVAQQNFELGNYHVAAFYTHAAVEKILKAAIIAFRRRAPMKTHNLKELHSEVADEVELSEEQQDFLGELTPAAQIARYVDAATAVPRDIYSKRLAERYLTAAQPILEAVKRRLQP